MLKFVKIIIVNCFYLLKYKLGVGFGVGVRVGVRVGDRDRVLDILTLINKIIKIHFYSP